ncbi:hypothetical protein L484_023049 [Morus notabilis]|uniref:Transmembrane protein n=1 Tax=Morus notabilis TaxID=981085 RepID=W9RKJ7_9ROSA|nr:uncharacterized protein LOC21405829 [Morus notabilis]EXB94940.1 hypothetical protein L484_023049 [Morus notabilis]
MSEINAGFSHSQEPLPSSSSSSSSPSSCFLLQAPKILLDSLKIFLRNKRIFLSIFALTTLPLSFLLFSLSLSSHRLRSHVLQLESLASLSPTRFEARQVWKESRDDAISILYTKALFLLPCFSLSLLAAVSAVTSVTLAVNGKRPTLHSAVTAVKSTWKRPLATSILVYALFLAYVPVPQTLSAAFPSPALRLLILTVGSVVEVYLMAVMSLAVVVSIAEERFGCDAIRVGSGLMGGRRVCGWVLSGLSVSATAFISGELEEAMDGQDQSRKTTSTMSSFAAAIRVAAGVSDEIGLVVLYGAVVLWSYVVFSIFYCDSRRRHGLKAENSENVRV